jgi:hypothetical protein
MKFWVPVFLLLFAYKGVAEETSWQSADEGQRRLAREGRGGARSNRDRGRSTDQRSGRGGGGPENGVGFINMLRNPKVRERLGISEDEAHRLKANMEAFEQQQHELRKQIHDLARQQAELLQQEDVSKDDVMALVEQIGAKRTEMAKGRMEQLLAMREIIGLERIRNLQHYMERQRKQKGERARGGYRDRPEPKPAPEPESETER